MSLGSLSLGVRCRTPTPQFPAFLQLSAPSGSMTVCCSRNQPRNILARGNEGQPSVCGFMSWLELARSASAVASCMDLLIDHLMMFGHDHLNATLHARAYPRLQARGRDHISRRASNRTGLGSQTSHQHSHEPFPVSHGGDDTASSGRGALRSLIGHVQSGEPCRVGDDGLRMASSAHKSPLPHPRASATPRPTRGSRGRPQHG